MGVAERLRKQITAQAPLPGHCDPENNSGFILVTPGTRERCGPGGAQGQPATPVTQPAVRPDRRAGEKPAQRLYEKDLGVRDVPGPCTGRAFAGDSPDSEGVVGQAGGSSEPPTSCVQQRSLHTATVLPLIL